MSEDKDKQSIEIKHSQGCKVLAITFIFCIGEPDLIDALIHFLMSK